MAHRQIRRDRADDIRSDGQPVEVHPGQTFGPILWTTYTLNDRVLKMTAQMPAIGPDDTPNIEQMKRFDKSRKGKKVSNEDWQSPTDPDSRILPTRDGFVQGYNAQAAVDSAGDAWCWGENVFGVLGEADLAGGDVGRRRASRCHGGDALSA